VGAIVGVVPNFSEGRRRDVIDAIVGALGVEGARVVFAEADPDHHRLDTTVLGTTEAVHRSAIAGAAVAIDRIDMFEHRGGHPRMGAVDVVPFMPVRGIEMAACVDLARAAGRELAETFAVPVYLYGEAAVAPERRSLADVRKGEFEGLRTAVAAGERLPDFGPHTIGRAGATAVGARKPLVAFNTYLSGTDEQAAKDIARGIRESAGGLPAVRAIGFAVPDRGCVTVSMNLVDFEVTGLRTAFDTVVAEASARGMEVLDSEIVGLAPEAAVPPGSEEQVRLKAFSRERQILERLIDAT
jgi:glutamate formiminotransferase / 5-formyltetrahydrofolate cyclo-ligase